MKTIVIIFNGINLPYHVIDYALEKATLESHEIHAIFLKGKREQKKGYIFPSDLGTAETLTSDKDAVIDDERIIADNMHLVMQMVENEKIPYRSTLKTNASIEDIKKVTASADLVVVDGNFDKMSLLSDKNISLKNLKKKISVLVQIIPNQEFF